MPAGQIPALFLDQSATNPWPYMGSSFAAIHGIGMTNGIYYQAEDIEITLSNQEDTAYVEATSEWTESVTIYGAEGTDEFYLGGSDALTNIHGNLNLLGGNDADDRMWIDNKLSNIDFDNGDGFDSVIGLGTFIGQGLDGYSHL